MPENNNTCERTEAEKWEQKNEKKIFALYVFFFLFSFAAFSSEWVVRAINIMQQYTYNYYERNRRNKKKIYAKNGGKSGRRTVNYYYVKHRMIQWNLNVPIELVYVAPMLSERWFDAKRWAFKLPEKRRSSWDNSENCKQQRTSCLLRCRRRRRQCWLRNAKSNSADKVCPRRLPWANHCQVFVPDFFFY